MRFEKNSFACKHRKKSWKKIKRVKEKKTLFISFEWFLLNSHCISIMWFVPLTQHIKFSSFIKFIYRWATISLLSVQLFCPSMLILARISSNMSYLEILFTVAVNFECQKCILSINLGYNRLTFFSTERFSWLLYKTYILT